MSTDSPVSLTRRARIIVPFLFAYGLAIYLAMGAVGDAFSGQPASGDSSVVVERGGAAVADGNVSSTAVAEALAAVDETPAIQELVRDQPVAVLRSGTWTAGEGGADGPEAGVGVALTIELPEPADVDLNALPGAEAGGKGAPRGLAATGGDTSQVERNVTSLLVLYDPASDTIVAAHPVPGNAPALTTEIGPAPDVAQRNERAERKERGEKRRAGKHRRGSRVSARG